MTITRALVLTALLLGSLHGLATGAEEIQFKRGDAAGTVRGQVTNTIKTYQFRARQGQSVTVSLSPNGGNKGTLTFTLYAYCGEEYGKPLAIDSIQWQDKLPCTDRYTIDVTPSAAAMREARVQRYALTVAIR
jgi:hypothetical protein